MRLTVAHTLAAKCSLMVRQRLSSGEFLWDMANKPRTLIHGPRMVSQPTMLAICIFGLHTTNTTAIYSADIGNCVLPIASWQTHAIELYLFAIKSY